MILTIKAGLFILMNGDNHKLSIYIQLKTISLLSISAYLDLLSVTMTKSFKTTIQ